MLMEKAPDVTIIKYYLKRVIRHSLERKRLLTEVEELLSARHASPAAELKELQAAVNEHLKTAELTRKFLGSISHELRNPLTVVKAAVSCLKSGSTGPVTPQQMKFIEMASRNVERQISMVEDILEFSKNKLGKQTADWKNKAV